MNDNNRLQVSRNYRFYSPLSPYAALAGAILEPTARMPAANASAVRRLTAASLSSLLDARTTKLLAVVRATRGAATVTEAPEMPLLVEANDTPTTPEDTAAVHAIAPGCGWLRDDKENVHGQKKEASKDSMPIERAVATRVSRKKRKSGEAMEVCPSR